MIDINLIEEFVNKKNKFYKKNDERADITLLNDYCSKIVSSFTNLDNFDVLYDIFCKYHHEKPLGCIRALYYFDPLSGPTVSHGDKDGRTSISEIYNILISDKKIIQINMALRDIKRNMSCQTPQLSIYQIIDFIQILKDKYKEILLNGDIKVETDGLYILLQIYFYIKLILNYCTKNVKLK